MSTVENISIALTHDMAALVRQAVESGDYASSSEALRTWKTQRELEAQPIETLRGLWREGIEMRTGTLRWNGRSAGRSPPALRSPGLTVPRFRLTARLKTTFC